MIGPIRRATIVVSDIEKSIAFYKDILGMEIFYDQEIGAEATGKLLGVPGAKVRIVSLSGEGSVVGMVGLLYFITPEIKPRRDIQSSIPNIDVALIFRTGNINEIYNNLQSAGVRIQCPPIEYEIPGRGAAKGMSCFDPDGILIEFTEHILKGNN